MYKIVVRNLNTNIKWIEYGFANHMMKRISYLNNEEDFEIIWVFKLSKSWDTFYKCLMRWGSGHS